MKRRDIEVQLRELRCNKDFMDLISGYYSKRFGTDIGQVTLQLGHCYMGYDISVHNTKGDIVHVINSAMTTQEAHNYIKALRLAADWLAYASEINK